MRLSVEDMTGPDPEKAGLCLRAIITLDGVKVDYCIVADDEAGYVERFVSDENGNVIAEGDEMKTERLTGKVRIIDPEALPLAEVYLK
jgi:hypothetical protein